MDSCAAINNMKWRIQIRDEAYFNKQNAEPLQKFSASEFSFEKVDGLLMSWHDVHKTVLRIEQQKIWIISAFNV